MRDVRLQGDGVDDRTAEEPVYYATLSVPVTADWRILVEGEVLQRLNFDIQLVTPDDPFEDPNGVPPGAVTPLDKNPLVAVFDKSQMAQITQVLGQNAPPQPKVPGSKGPAIRPMKTPYGRG